MSNCDNWVVLKIEPEASGGQEVFYKLLQGWSGGYTYGNSWHMNSGITEVSLEESKSSYKVRGASGSVYSVPKEGYGVRMNIAGVIHHYDEKYPNCIKVMPDCDWASFKFN